MKGHHRPLSPIVEVRRQHHLLALGRDFTFNLTEIPAAPAPALCG
jgi:hypothetical protein